MSARANRMCVLAGAIGVAMMLVGAWLMWSIDAGHLSLEAYGDALGIALVIIVMGFAGVAGAVIGWEEI